MGMMTSKTFTETSSEYNEIVNGYIGTITPVNDVPTLAVSNPTEAVQVMNIETYIYDTTDNNYIINPDNLINTGINNNTANEKDSNEDYISELDYGWGFILKFDNVNITHFTVDTFYFKNNDHNYTPSKVRLWGTTNEDSSTGYQFLGTINIYTANNTNSDETVLEQTHSVDIDNNNVLKNQKFKYFRIFMNNSSGTSGTYPTKITNFGFKGTGYKLA